MQSENRQSVVGCFGLWWIWFVMSFLVGFLIVKKFNEERGVSDMDIMSFITVILNAAMLLLTFMSYRNKKDVVRPHADQAETNHKIVIVHIHICIGRWLLENGGLVNCRFSFISIIISLFLCVYNDSLVFVYFIYVWLFSIWFYHIKKGRSLVRTPCCSYFTATLLPRTSYRYGSPVPASFLRRDGRSLSRQDGLLSCIPLGAMVNYVEICWTL